MIYRAASTMICFAFILPFELIGAPAFAEQVADLTPAETAQVNSMADSVEQQCKTQVVTQLKDRAAKANDSATPSWVAKLTSGDYCTCIGHRIRAGLTPAQVRKGTQADGEALVKNSANACAVDHFKATFPDICRSWSEGAPTTQQAQACTCVQKRVDQITGDTLAETVKQTVGDYVRWQHHRDAPLEAGPSSLMSSYLACFKEADLAHP